jgi:hypothetical protein
MKGGLWFAAGAGAAVYVMIRGRRAAEALTVDGLQDRLNGLAVGARLFRDEVAQGKAEAETELRERFALALPGHRELTTSQNTSKEEEGRG